MKRTKIQLQPTVRQMAQMIEAIKKQGKHPEGHTYTWCFQLIFDSYIAHQESIGNVKPFSEEEAIEYLEAFSAKGAANLDMEDLELDVMGTIDRVEKTTSPEVAEALKKAGAGDDIEDVFGI